MNKLIITAIATVLAGCATPSPSTASGHPEVTVTGSGTVAPLPDKVAGALAGLCTNNQLIVESSTPTQVTCSKEATGARAVLAQALIGNAYSTTPVYHWRFNIIPVGTGLRIVWDESVSTQMAFGQTRLTPINNAKDNTNMQNILDQMNSHWQQELATKIANK